MMNLKHCLAGCLFAVSLSANAAETVCNNNSGSGWPIPISSTTNISIPYQFGDISVAHDVNVDVDITKHYVGDLTARVTSPQGTTVLLFERPGTTLGENVASAPWGCSQDDISVIFDDEAAIGTNIENVCGTGIPSISGTYLPHNASPNDLSAIDGEDPTGNWAFQLVHVAPFDPGTLNEVCITASFAAVTFDKWVSSNSTCSDQIDTLNVARGTNVYYCYIANNPGSETFSINAGNATDSLGHNISALETTYNPTNTQAVIVGPVIAGSAQLPYLATTVNNAQVTASFATPNFTGTLVTGESANVTVGDPVINTSTKTVLDVNGGTAEPGDVLRYTITINESAGFLTSNVSLTDVVDANLSGVTIT
ncbi:MAG: proprotein convertase P-domain-containing protein, partial [Gammaproteobacteria bacterium]